MKALAILVLLFSVNSFAANCFNVYNSKQVYDCFMRVSDELHGTGELTNSIGVSRADRGFEALTKILNEQGKSAEGLKEKYDYIGVAMIHFDEDEVHYYGVKRGARSEVTVITSVYIVDLSYDHPKTLVEDPLAFALGLENIEDWHYDDIEEARKYYLEEQAEEAKK